MVCSNKLTEQFAGRTLEQWEDAVFMNPDYYVVVKRHGRGNMARAEFQTYPEALVVANKVPQSLLYVVSKEGRWVCLVRSRWQHYLDMYNRATGQRLRLPGLK